MLAVPKWVRWHMREKPSVTSGLLKVFLRAVETTIRQRSPGAPAGHRARHRRLSRPSRPRCVVLTSGGCPAIATSTAPPSTPSTPLSQQRLGRLDAERLIYSLRKPTLYGRTELILTPLELLDRLAHLVTPPRIHKHCYCGLLAPNARPRRAVTETAGPAGATLQLLQEARQKMDLSEPEPAPATAAGPTTEEQPKAGIRSAAARCWALLLARIFECLPLLCPRCGEPMRIIAFMLDPAVIERILPHIGEPTEAPPLWLARGPLQAELGFYSVDQTAGTDTWD